MASPDDDDDDDDYNHDHDHDDANNDDNNKDLEIEIERMWGLKTTTVLVVIGALGIIKKGMESYINKIPGNINIHELQQITLLSTARLLRRALSIR